MPPRRRRRIAIEEEDEDEAEPMEQVEEIEPLPSQVAAKNDSVSNAVLAILAMASKGPIKEVDLRPLLLRDRYRDWQDGLTELNKIFSTAFGYTIVYDGTARQFFLRNDLITVKAQIIELFNQGTLNHERIDNGFFSASQTFDAQEENFSNDDKRGLLFTLLACIMMSNNVELGHKHWSAEHETIKHMCIQVLGISEALFDKLLGGTKAEFIKEGWIRKSEEMVANQDAMIRYHWGPRSVTTVSTSYVFGKFCMVNQTNKLEWGNYEEVLRQLDQKNDLYYPDL